MLPQQPTPGYIPPVALVGFWLSQCRGWGESRLSC
jgi:hypothetical protein